MEKIKVLIVDDEPNFAQMLKLNLEATGGYIVRVENQGSKAIEAARGFMPRIIFLDIVMPDMDGPQILALCREDALLKNVPVVFLTALVPKDELSLDGPFIAGNAFLAKPVTTEQLVTCIKRLVK
ncbi:MAG: response regulator [Candidatus Omnitrophica bacterium]|nr:response regulator [Candidatus Omnitrophota bacterium]